ncbi:MAG: type II toxin-antitoxin system HicB family antitoxin [Planctomycetes bacterium]|nr:type II toxin-antitoxin system HicB family antitoxin [Planctomycetota bacterium]
MTVVTTENAEAHLQYEIFTDKTVYECRVWLTPEECGGFSVEIVSLPGVVSEGESEKEAISNLKEAFRAAIAVYSDLDQDIPWSGDIPKEIPLRVKERWILVDA